MFASRCVGLAMVPACLILAACGGGGGGSTPTTTTNLQPSNAAPATPSQPDTTVTPGPSAPAGVQTAAAAGSVDFTWTEDATRSFFNDALELPWAVEMGAWRDRNGTAQGTLPFASLAFVDQPEEQVVRWDVTELVREHGADFLIKRSGGTNVRFHSRESADAAKRPRLIVSRPQGLQTYAPTADTSLNSTTAKSLGGSDTLSSTGPILIKFDVAADPTVVRVELELTATTEQFGNQTLEVFRADPRPRPLEAPSLLAGTSADVVFRLAGADWRGKTGGFRTDSMNVNADGSLTVRIPTGGDTGSQALYSIPAAARRETMFARAVMKVHSDWTGAVGGKYPGLTNTGQGDKRAVPCGWGGRLADGTCWSVRTNRKGYVAGTPFADTHQALAPYAYRINRTTSNGEGPASSRAVPKGRYFVLDQMVKLNSLGSDGAPRADGEVAYWLNGELIGRMTGVIFRNHLGPETLPSEYWLDVYEGGTGYAAPSDHSVSFAEVVVSTQLLPFDGAALARLNGGGQ